MADPVWGMLAKGQADPEKIEEAIARMIAAHEADEASHLGVGESLQSHAASEIIDHLAESIVEDKFATGSVSSRAITTDQLIGKDIRTAEDVGSVVDGVKLNSSGLEMWQGGDNKVSIPISGNAWIFGPGKRNTRNLTDRNLSNRAVSIVLSYNQSLNFWLNDSIARSNRRISVNAFKRQNPGLFKKT